MRAASSEGVRERVVGAWCLAVVWGDVADVWRFFAARFVPYELQRRYAAGA